MCEREDGWGPSLPDGVSFLLLAEPVRGPVKNPYGIYGVSSDAEFQASEKIELVSNELNELISSAKTYPPALALAQHQIGVEQTQTKEEFVQTFTRLLKSYLGAQSTSPYFMARVARGELGYKLAGGFYWIIGYNRQHSKVAWISRDFQIYNDDVGDFDVSQELLLTRFSSKET